MRGRPIFLCLALIGLAPASTAGAPRQGFTVQRGLVYGRHDGVELTGDLYAPEAPGKHPALVAVHGGGWQEADSSLYKHWGPYLARRGYVLFAVNYRLAKDTQAMYPQAVQDVRAAVQFLRSRGGALGVDPDRLGLMGDSAGAHLAALAAVAGDRPPFAGSYPDDPYAAASAQVKACVAVYGIYDLAAQWDFNRVHTPDDNITQVFLGAGPAERPAQYHEGSPLTYAPRGRALPAFLLAWGTKDDHVDPGPQSEAFANALGAAGAQVQSVVLPGAGHFWASDPIDPGSRPALLAPRLLRFLRRRL